MPTSFDMEGGVGPLHTVGQADHGPRRLGQALGLLSSGFKIHGTHNAPFSPSGILCLFLNLEHGKLERLRHTSNASEGEVCLIINLVSGAHGPMCLGA